MIQSNLSFKDLSEPSISDKAGQGILDKTGNMTFVYEQSILYSAQM